MSLSLNSLFVVIEGDEGTGKSTVAPALCAELERRERATIHMREPGGVKGSDSLAEELRVAILRKDRPEIIDPVTDVLLHSAYRRQNVVNIIIPGLNEGKVVVSERFIPSTYALNVAPFLTEDGAQSDVADVFMGTAAYVLRGIPEPLTFLLDLSHNEALRQERMAGRPGDRYEDSDKAATVTAAYASYHQQPNTVVLDASKPVEDLVTYMADVIEASIQKQKDRAAEFDAQMAQSTAATEAGEPTAEAGELELMVDPAPFDLEVAITEFTTTQVVPGLFNNDESVVPAYQELAAKYIRSVWAQNPDETMFEGQARRQLIQQIHSLFYYGHQLVLFKDKVAAADEVCDAVDGGVDLVEGEEETAPDCDGGIDLDEEVDECRKEDDSIKVFHNRTDELAGGEEPPVDTETLKSPVFA